jgi:hypothetical protein
MSDLSEEIQEIKQELQQVKERNKELEQKIEKQESGKNSSDSAGKSENISRRKFLKMAGLGAGAIGLTSATSAWSILQPSGQGTSDIDATNLQGNTPSDFATQTDINNHAGDNSAHHSRYSDGEARGAVRQVQATGSLDVSQAYVDTKVVSIWSQGDLKLRSLEDSSNVGTLYSGTGTKCTVQYWVGDDNADYEVLTFE